MIPYVCEAIFLCIQTRRALRVCSDQDRAHFHLHSYSIKLRQLSCHQLNLVLYTGPGSVSVTRYDLERTSCIMQYTFILFCTLLSLLTRYG